jgi:GNAT superfamily N-acetyltransferase
MVVQLKNAVPSVAEKIYNVFQSAYKVEALLIKASHFPPLSRMQHDIVRSNALFYGFYCESTLAGVIEIKVKNKCLSIESLTVHPSYFKKGIAGKLIAHALKSHTYNKAVVETAVANTPAINLYKKQGFSEYKQWLPAHGILKTAMLLELN